MKACQAPFTIFLSTGPIVHRARHTSSQLTSTEHKEKNMHSTCGMDPIIGTFCKKEHVRLYQSSSTMQISHRVSRNLALKAVKETQNNEVELQTDWDRKVHYAID